MAPQTMTAGTSVIMTETTYHYPADAIPLPEHG
jgi:hypothetical protein